MVAERRYSGRCAARNCPILSAEAPGNRVNRTPTALCGSLADTTSPEAVMTSLHPGSWNGKPMNRVGVAEPLTGWMRMPVLLMSEARQR